MTFDGDIVYSEENGISEVILKEVREGQVFVTCCGPLSMEKDNRTTLDALPEFELMKSMSAKDIDIN